MSQGGVQSVARALGLLRLLARSSEGLRVSDLARASGLPVSTAHRLLTTLEQEGFAQFDPELSLWHVGREAFSVGAAFGQKRNFVAPAMPFLKRLRDLTRETANLGILEAGRIVTISQVESREIVRAISVPGGSVPVFCSGMGKAILATWPDEAIRALAERSGLHPMTSHSLRSIDAALGEIAVVRKTGYAVDDEEHAIGLRCLAAVVWSPDGEPACALSVSGLRARMTSARMAVIAEQVKDVAAQMTEALGGVRPD